MSRAKGRRIPSLKNDLRTVVMLRERRHQYAATETDRTEAALAIGNAERKCETAKARATCRAIALNRIHNAS